MKISSGVQKCDNWPLLLRVHCVILYFGQQSLIDGGEILHVVRLCSASSIRGDGTVISLRPRRARRCFGSCFSWRKAPLPTNSTAAKRCLTTLPTGALPVTH